MGFFDKWLEPILGAAGSIFGAKAASEAGEAPYTVEELKDIALWNAMLQSPNISGPFGSVNTTFRNGQANTVTQVPEWMQGLIDRTAGRAANPDQYTPNPATYAMRSDRWARRGYPGAPSQPQGLEQAMVDAGMVGGTPANFNQPPAAGNPGYVGSRPGSDSMPGGAGGNGVPGVGGGRTTDRTGEMGFGLGGWRGRGDTGGGSGGIDWSQFDEFQQGTGGGLAAYENRGNIGALIGALLGIPGGRQAGNWIGDYLTRDMVWSSPIESTEYNQGDGPDDGGLSRSIGEGRFTPGSPWNPEDSDITEVGPLLAPGSRAQQSLFGPWGAGGVGISGLNIGGMRGQPGAGRSSTYTGSTGGLWFTKKKPTGGGGTHQE